MSLHPPHPFEKFVAPGAAHVPVAGGAPALHVSFVLAPRFTMLAFTAALEPFRIANQLAGQALFRWSVHSEDGQPVTASNGLAVLPDAALPAEAPAGWVLVCGGVTPDRTMGATLGHWLRAQWRRGRAVGGLCTGAYALARAGILRGRRFTLHWENIAGFRETFPELSPERQIFCVDERIITCAGGVAAADLALHLIATHHGVGLARKVMEMCLLTAQRGAEAAQLPSTAARLATRNATVLRAAEFLERDCENGFDLRRCADHVGTAPRQLQRLFRQHLGCTPRQFAAELRLDRGRMLLAETNMSVTEVAIACGYASRSAFSKGFRARFGTSPQRFSAFTA